MGIPDGWQRYRPPNGSTGAAFMVKWCDKCAMDDPENKDFCPIIGNTMVLDVDHPDYPDDWIIPANEPRMSEAKCTAFRKTPPPYRCAKTGDLEF